MIHITKKDDTFIFNGHTKPDLCASVSCIMYTTVNALMMYDEKAIEYSDDDLSDEVKITILKHDSVIDLLIDNMIKCFNDLIEDENVKDYVNLRIL